MPSSSPAYPAFTFFSAPLSPHPPSPVGKGETKVIFMQGASPLASPGAEPAPRLQPLPIRCQAGGVPALSPACHAFSLISFPHPPDPLPSGKGGIKVISCKGLRPLHSRGAEPARRLQPLPIRCQAGGVPALSPACHAFSLISFPHPPDPLPSGKGGIKVISCKGLRPLHSRGLNPRFAAKPTERFPYGQCRQPRRGGTGGDGTIRRKRRRRLRWSSPPGQVEPATPGASPRRVSGLPLFPAPLGFSPGDARGEAPCIRKLKVSPFPGGEGGKGGWGQKSKLKAGAVGDQPGTPPPDITAAGRAGNAGGKPPPGEWFAPAPGAAWVQPRGCKGRSPLHKKTKSLPLPRRGRGEGGMGAEKQAKGRGGRRPTGHAPSGHHSGRSSRQRRGQAPAG